MKKILVKDDFTFGILIGVLIPAITWVVLTGLSWLLTTYFNISIFHNESYIILLSITTNLMALRYYLKSLKFDKTGRGILGVSFLFVLLFFIFFHK